MVNVLANRPNLVIALVNVAFDDAGINTFNTYKILKFGTPFQYYFPAEPLNSITDFEKDQVYIIWPKQNMDLTGIVANVAPPDLEIKPGINVFQNTWFAGIALQTVDFASIALDATNIRIIHHVGNPFESWDPNDSINSCTGFVVDEAYYGYALDDIDLSDYLIPPVVIPSDINQEVDPFKYYGTKDTTAKGYYDLPTRFYDDLASFPATGIGDVIFVAEDTNTLYRWDGATYVSLGSGGGAGEANTASNLGGGLANYDSKSGVDLRFNSFDSADFDLASNLISIDATKKSNWNAAYNDKINSAAFTGTTTKTLTLTQQDGGTVTANFTEVDEVLFYSDYTSFPGTGATGIIYVDESDGILYRWDGSSYIQIGGSEPAEFIPDHIVSGGKVIWQTGLTFDVTAAIYYIGGQIYASPATTITLNAADPTNPRFDLLVLTTSGTATKVTGTAAASPSEPQIDPATQLYLTAVLVEAGATTPTGATNTIIYDENTEWTTSTNGTISVNFNSTTTPSSGTKAAAVASWSTGAYISFANGSPVNTGDVVTISLKIRLGAALSKNQNISLQFISGALAASQQITLPIDKTITGAYQLIALSNISFVLATFDRVRIIFSGATSNLIIDEVKYQKGVSNPSGPEVDPTVPVLVKQIPVSADASTVKYLWWDGSKYLRKQVAYSELSGTPSIPTQYTDEMAQDAVGAMVSSEFTYTDATPLLAINSIAYSKITGGPTQYTDEMAMDAIAAMFAAGSHTNITFTYNDVTNSIDATVSGVSISIGAFNTTSVAEGLSLISGVLKLHAADPTNPGAVTTGTQTFAGAKLFQNLVHSDDRVEAYFFQVTAKISTPGTPSTNEGKIYQKSDGKLYFLNDAGTEYDLTASGSSYSAENAQDDVGGILTDTDTVDFTYNDATPSIIADVKKQMSITSDSSGLKLVGDSASPGNTMLYGTNGSGTKGWYAQPTDTDTHIGNTNLTLSANRTLSGGGNYLQFQNGRFEMAKGADVASANDLTLGNDGNTFGITGTTTINAITTTNWQAGSDVFLIFAGALTLKHNTAGGAGTAKIFLSGSADLTTAANDCIHLKYDGTQWQEVGRKTAASNTPGIDTVLAVGQALTTNRTIAAGANILLLTGSNTSAVIQATNSAAAGTAAAVVGIGSSSAIGVSGFSSSGNGLSGDSTSGNGMVATSTSGLAMRGTVNPTSTSTEVDVIEVRRTTSGTAANGIGSVLAFVVETDNGSLSTSSRIVSRWSTATNASRVSEMAIKLVNAAVEAEVFTFQPDATLIQRNSPTVQTTNATLTTVRTIPLATSGTQIELDITIRGESGNNIVMYTRLYRVKNVAGTLTALGSFTTIGTDFEDAALASCSCSVALSGTNIQIQATGIAATTIDWKVLVNAKFFE